MYNGIHVSTCTCIMYNSISTCTCIMHKDISTCTCTCIMVYIHVQCICCTCTSTCVHSSNLYCLELSYPLHLHHFPSSSLHI